mgnify:CR=1 FL=1|tara:strand:- start:102 stop:593 length:492 start_codon:yes stop_codon:yes gene_type:complete
MIWKDILKEDVEEEILDEVEAEGGALGMKNLKDIADKKKLKETISDMKEDGKLFEHKHGDYYTHEPVKKWEEVIKILETQLGFSSNKFDSESSYRSYQRALRETNDRKGFLKELVKRYKQNNKQPLTSDIVNSVLSAFKYTRGERNTQSVSGGGVMGGNDYGF